MKRMYVLVAALWTVVACLPAFAQTDEEKARAILEANKKAVVTVKMVIKEKYSMGGESQDNESKTEATGAVIGDDGLTVLALSSTDPTTVIRNMMGSRADDMEMSCEITDMKFLLDDGTEISAKVVLRDNELDLAYARPLTKPAAPMAFIDLKNEAKPQLLEQLVAVNRLGKVANRVYALSFERVEAIVDKPRTFYAPGQDPTNSAQGSPVFALDGKIVGIFVLRTIKDTSGGRGGMFGGSRENMMPILLPAADILESAQQVPAWDAAGS